MPRNFDNVRVADVGKLLTHLYSLVEGLDGRMITFRVQVPDKYADQVATILGVPGQPPAGGDQLGDTGTPTDQGGTDVIPAGQFDAPADTGGDNAPITQPGPTDQGNTGA